LISWGADAAPDYADVAVALLQRGLLVVFGSAKPRDHADFAKPLQQIRETLAVFLADGGEFQAESTAGFYVADHSLGLDLPFLDKKIEIGLRAYRLGQLREDEQATRAKIAHLRSIVISGRAPAHVDLVRNMYA
jgi:hypothetical protein